MPVMPEVVCPHCQQKGKVDVKRVKRSTRLSLTRMAGAAVTMGGSLAMTGVTKKTPWINQCKCGHCGMRWDA